MGDTDPAKIECIKCAYDLRGLSPDGFCPECGSRVRDSLGRFTLRTADPAWLTKLRWGCGLLCVWGLLMAVGLASAVQPAAAFVVPPLVIIATIVFVSAAFLATSRLPAGRAPAADPTSRRAARWSLLLPAVAITSFLVLPADGAITLVFLSIVIPINLALWYARALWNRIPNKFGSGFATCVAIIYSFCTMAVTCAVPLFAIVVAVAPPVLILFGGMACGSPPPPKAAGWVETVLIGMIPIPFSAVFGALSAAIPAGTCKAGTIDS